MRFFFVISPKIKVPNIVYSNTRKQFRSLNGRELAQYPTQILPRQNSTTLIGPTWWRGTSGWVRIKIQSLRYAPIRLTSLAACSLCRPDFFLFSLDRLTMPEPGSDRPQSSLPVQKPRLWLLRRSPALSWSHRRSPCLHKQGNSHISSPKNI